MTLLVAAVAYLIGSLSAGILYSRARGHDVRDRDLPGGSGIYRQYGPGAAVLVSALDILKGAVAVLIARALTPDATWVATLFVVLGHCYPAYFRLNGGGGIAPLLGALLIAAPATLGLTLLVALLVMVPYKWLLQRTVRLNVVPVAAAVAVPTGLLFAARYGGTADLLAGGGAMLLRAAHLLLNPRKA
ncbi:glycerol-3-phosphate acyltransferase [Deinococcus maricopensis]|uniref:Uncharacterized protein n=1 Tax=Deinococcus maricopensis (strain DSM 21211 / LMG 22137 / NRRL B-23946 / LB-34) TaxID=709986 RepID=E8U6K9_DEIML|nr:glycerol-3-phosphate acyltransferase [Deinococcus maricopensis]ADV66698.1 protein of unknown function DUF205 [Deinococcus maricopensis DSM 21211]